MPNARTRWGWTTSTRCVALQEQLAEVIEPRGIGEVDGNEIAVDGSEGSLYAYGPDARAILQAALPVVCRSPLAAGGHVYLRYGDARRRGSDGGDVPALRPVRQPQRVTAREQTPDAHPRGPWFAPSTSPLAGDWTGAHEIVQQDETDPTSCWVHAVLHKIEGDAANARYWYRLSGRPTRPTPTPRGSSRHQGGADVLAARPSRV